MYRTRPHPILLTFLGLVVAVPAGVAGTRLEELMARRRALRDGEDAPATPGARVQLPRPSRDRVERLQLTLDAVPKRMEEDQTSAAADTYLAVGRKVETSISFLPGGNLRRNKEESAEALAVFLTQPAEHIYSLGVRVLAYKEDGDVRTAGRTPPVGKVEIYEVREVGDIRGDLVHQLEGIYFDLGGKVSEIPVGIDTRPDRRYMAVLSVPSPPGKESFITVGAAKEGEYRALRLDPKHGLPLEGGRVRDASVLFSYRPDPGAVRPTTVVEGEFLASLQRFLRDNPDAESIPLRLELEPR